MWYDITFRTHEKEGKRSFSWFVFNINDSSTIRAGFETKRMAMSWALANLGTQ